MAEINGDKKTTVGTESRITIRFAIACGVFLTSAIVGSNRLLSRMDSNQLKTDFRFETLETKINDLQKSIGDNMGDRWTRADDKHYMADFANENGLKAPRHGRSSN